MFENARSAGQNRGSVLMSSSDQSMRTVFTQCWKAYALTEFTRAAISCGKSKMGHCCLEKREFRRCVIISGELMKRRKIKIMQRISKNLKYLLAVLVVSVTIVMGLSACAPAEAGTDYGSSMVGTFWSLIPPVVAIALALITKEVHSSLFAGIVVGALFYTKFNILGTIDVVLKDGFIGSLSDAGNVGIILFLAILGIMVALMNTTGVQSLRRVGAEKDQVEKQFDSGDLRSRCSHLYRRLFQLSDCRQRHETDYGYSQRIPCEISLYYRFHSGSDLHDRSDFFLGGCGFGFC